jgi:uncharacterized protein YjiK
MTFYKTILPFATVLCVLFVSCNTTASSQNPQGYNFSQPERTKMPGSLNEISGIVFLKGNPDHLFAIEDEDGRLYRYTFSSQKTRYSRFFSKGDFEDLAVLQDSVFVALKSDGTLYTFPIAEAENENAGKVKEYKSLLPKAEYEGLFAKNGRLYILCKDCADKNAKKTATVYEIILPVNAKPAVVKPIKINFEKTGKGIDTEKKILSPSGLAFHPLTNEWYLLSSVNNLLLVMDAGLNPKAVYKLDPSLFKQPEGITFSKNGDMYISNEAAGGTANVLLFRYNPQLKK